MRTEKITPSNLFSQPRRYLVPIFQRGYVWTLPAQIKPLWRDIVYQTSNLLEAKAQKRKYERMHFMGAVVLKQAETSVRNTAASDVIDGQQRITTLQVFLVALRDVLRSSGDDFLLNKLIQLTTNPDPIPHPDEQFKIWPTSSLREEVRAIFNAGSADEVRRLFPRQKIKRTLLPRPLLAQAYLFLFSAIFRYVRGHDFEEPVDYGERDELDDLIAQLGFDETLPDADQPILPERAEALLTAVTNHLQIIEINLERGDDAQVIFETLNARGAPLLAADLVRNFIFLYATRKGEDPQGLYERFWQPFDEESAQAGKSVTGRFWKDEERQGRLRRSRMDLFLFHYITQRLRAEFTIATLFDRFREWWESGKEDRNVEAELADLRASASVFKALLLEERSSAFGQIAYRIRQLDTTTVYPLILFLASKSTSLDDVRLLQCLRDIESYLLRRMICGLTPKAYNRTFLTVLRNLAESSAAFQGDSVGTVLRTLKGETVFWPSDETLEAAWFQKEAYGRLKQPRLLMILEAIESSMDTNKQESSSAFDKGRSPSIEHIWPQNGNAKDWLVGKFHASEGLSESDVLATRRDIQSWGNLTLLTQPLNSAVGNGPYAGKREAILDQSVLRLNRYFGKPEATDWGREQIRARGQVLLRQFISVWPGPSKNV